MAMERPAYKLTTSKPGSDLAGETAAAMAAGSLVFRNTDASYAEMLLEHAKEIYGFATTYTGKYSDSIQDANIYYKSYNGYQDELAWAAIWLYKASREPPYIDDARIYLSHSPQSSELSWDDKSIGASLLMYSEDSHDVISKSRIEYFVNFWLNDVKHTPSGLAWLMRWGPNRYAANAAFALDVAADLGFSPSASRSFCEDQIRLMLGDAGRSYVVGFGHNPPTKPHHASSSCPDAGVCNWNDFHSPKPNPHTLYGALVGGPDQRGSYVDDRSDYIKNEVTCDYNAGFQSAVAGLLYRHLPK